MLPVPSLLHGGVLRTHLGGLCLRRGGRGTGGGAETVEPGDSGTDASLGLQLGRRVCLPPREADDGCSGAPRVGSVL